MGKKAVIIIALLVVLAIGYIVYNIWPVIELVMRGGIH